MTPWGTFGLERAADALIGVASASEEHALVERPHEESAPVVAISFVTPEPEPAELAVTPAAAAPRRWNPELLLERSFGGPSSWMR